MIRRIDWWLLDRVFQPVVDLLQRQPAWIARQCVLFGLVANCVRHFAFDSRPLWVVALVLFSFAILAAFTLHSLLFASLGGNRFARWFYLVLFVADLAWIAFALLIGPTSLIGLVFKYINGFTFFAFFYFAACRPPRPRLPRHSAKLAHGGAA